MQNLFAIDIVNTTNLESIGLIIGLKRSPSENADQFATRCHYRIDELMRTHAHGTRDKKTLTFLELHDEIEKCFSPI